MNTEIAVHPRLQHYGLLTGNFHGMIDWYQKVLGMTVNHRAEVPATAAHRPPFSAFGFVSNDELDHRIVFFEMPGASVDPDKGRHAGLQHVAFSCATIDDLLGTYLRLKGLGILPLWAADHGVGISLYYQDPDQNRVEINASNYSDAWTATEHLRVSRGMMELVSRRDAASLGTYELCTAWSAPVAHIRDHFLGTGSVSIRHQSFLRHRQFRP